MSASTDPYPKQPVEDAMHVSAAAPLEHKLVEVALHVPLAEAVEEALGPSLEVQEDAVDQTRRRSCAFRPVTTRTSWVFAGTFSYPSQPSVTMCAPGSTDPPMKPCRVSATHT
jgi:hypothetical protein